MSRTNIEALSNTIDSRIVDGLLKRIEDNSVLLDEIVDRLVSFYCKPIDETMANIRALLDDKENPVSDEELDAIVLKLPNLLYFTGEGLESLGIREDVATAVERDVYNKVHTEATGTVAVKESQAEMASQSEYITKTALSRAYKKIKLRLEAGWEMLASAKKVLTRRMSAYDLGNVDNGRFNNGRRRSE